MKRFLLRFIATAILAVGFLSAGVLSFANAENISNKAWKGDSEKYVGDTSFFCLYYEDHKSVIDAYKGDGGFDASYDTADALTIQVLAVPLSVLATHCKYLSEGIVAEVPSAELLALETPACAPVDQNDISQGCYITVPATLTIDGEPPIRGYTSATIDSKAPSIASAGQ